ncbi:MAG: 30S ribosomal protein S6e [Nanoarchaeota archaeon]|nr:30S ribosomal protein S6e [Nanoarchaeota archaeon]
MVDFKVVISDANTGKTYQKEVKDENARKFLGLKIGDKLKADFLGIGNIEVEVTGGSDYCGFPMRKDVLGTGRKKILAVGGVGIKSKEKGIKQRKTVCGNTIHAKISQINVKILSGKPLKVKEEKKEKKHKAEENPAEVKKEPEKKEKQEGKSEAKKEPKKEEKVPTAAGLAEKKEEAKK